ncbi:MAG: monovalent cation/H+ antiporter complex subunit F [Rhodospirillaceae bacterium]|jgi:multicomponent Na+:H+ antiporter subunit F
MTMFGVATAAVLVAMALVLIRAFAGPTVYDRILVVNVFGNLSVLLIALYGFLSGRPDFLDIAIVYALINFIATIAVTKYIKFDHLGRPRRGEEVDDL